VPIAGARVHDLTTPELLVNGAPKTEHISAVIVDLERPESIASIGQFPMDRNLPASNSVYRELGSSVPMNASQRAHS